MDQVKNFAKVSVSGGYDNSVTTVTLITGQGSLLPDTTKGPYNLVWWEGETYPDPTDDPNKEIVRVTNRTGDTLTIIRGQEGTSAATHSTASKPYFMLQAFTKQLYDDLYIFSLTF